MQFVNDIDFYIGCMQAKLREKSRQPKKEGGLSLGSGHEKGRKS
jgi:hypothetical protein